LNRTIEGGLISRKMRIKLPEKEIFSVVRILSAKEMS